MRMRLAFVFSLLASAALAQSGVAVKQSGNVTPNTVPWWISSGAIAGGVTSADSPVSSFGVTNNGYNGICTNSQRITAAGRQTLCMGVTDTGGGRITLQNYGTDTAQPFQFVINGTTITPAGGITALTVGSTTIGGGTNLAFLYDNGGVLGNLTQPGLDVRLFAVSPKTPGTVCNGSGDDTATIQAAVNFASTANGGTIVVPAGQCQVSSPGISLLNKTNVRISGQGAGDGFFNAAVTSITYTSATGSAFVVDGANGFEFDHAAVLYSNASYNGDLVDLRQVSGSQNTELISIHDCFMAGTVSSTANSLIRTGLTLSLRVDRCIFQKAVQIIRMGAASNNIWIGNSFFNQGSSTSHIGVQGEGITLINDSFEPSLGTVANNITANGATNGLSIIGLTINDGATGTPISLTGGVVTGLSITGSIIQGGTFSINVGSAIGVSIIGNSLSANSTCNIIISSATLATIASNYNQGGGQSVCTGPTAPYFFDDSVNGYYISSLALGGSTAHGVVIAEGTNTGMASTAAMINGQLLVGQNAADPLPKTITGDWTLSAAGAATLATVNSNVGTFGDATHVPQITVNGKGLTTAVTSVLITGTTPGGAAGGGLSGTYPNPTVATNANLTGPITSIGNATSIASQTGTGTKFVMDTSPTLVTPNIGAATGTSLKLGGSAMTAVIDVDQGGGDVFSYRFNSSNPRFDFAIGGGSGTPAFGVNFVWSGSGNVFNFDKTGGAFLIGNLIGASSPFLLCANTGTAGASTGFDAATNCGFSMTTGGIPVIGVTAPTGSRGEFGIDKITASGTAPGAASAKLSVVAGTNAGTCKLIMYAGTSTTPTTVIDNVGSGC